MLDLINLPEEERLAELKKRLRRIKEKHKRRKRPGKWWREWWYSEGIIGVTINGYALCLYLTNWKEFCSDVIGNVFYLIKLCCFFSKDRDLKAVGEKIYSWYVDREGKRLDKWLTNYFR